MTHETVGRYDFGALRHFHVGADVLCLRDPGDTVAGETVPGSIYEPSVTYLLRHLMGAQRTFCDIGALYGYFSCLVSALHPGCIVHAFEPNLEHFGVLVQNMGANSVRGFAHAVALTGSRSDVRFRNRTIVASDAMDALTVAGVTFDAFADEAGLRDVFAKVDVHGAEGGVLDGMRSSLKDRIGDLVIEIHARHLLVGSYEYGAMVDILEESGHDVFELERFREEDVPVLTPLEGDARRRFVDYSLWSPGEIAHERMLYSTRDPSRIRALLAGA